MDANGALAAAVADDDMPSSLRRGKRPKVSHPDWVMVDGYIRRMSGGSGRGTILAYEFTSTGDLIGVGFRAAAPPETSRLLFHWFPNANRKKGKGFRFRRDDGQENSARWSPREAKAVAAHRNSMLLRFRLPTKGFIVVLEEFFLYQAAPLTLTRLPPCGHPLINYDSRNNVGILCHEDSREIAVAHLTVSRKEYCDAGDDECPVTAEVCCRFLRQDNSWSTRCFAVPIIHGEGKGEDLLWWESDAVLPLGDSICWVDYLRGILICDVFSPNPRLRYVPLPVIPYDGSRHPELDDRGSLCEYRSVCVANDGHVRFVDAATGDDWFLRSPNCFSNPCNITSRPVQHIPTPPIITCWRLSNDGVTWMVDGWIQVDRFYDLTEILELPYIRPGFPLIDIKNPHIIYFVLKEKTISSPKTLLVPADMLTQRLGRPIAYALKSSTSDEEIGYRSSCNICYDRPFLPSEFSRYLDLDVLDRRFGHPGLSRTEHNEHSAGMGWVTNGQLENGTPEHSGHSAGKGWVTNGQHENGTPDEQSAAQAFGNQDCSRAENTGRPAMNSWTEAQV